ncbi:MAG TPA: hypothetical protein VHZ76_08990 [Gammaproteobacteria bacterium]|jgi:hypothetical protein|nr:hypothetical protein [Gammaproteobacteria bacterium]
MKKYMMMAIISALCMSSMQAMMRSQQFSLTNNSIYNLTINVWQANMRRSGQKLITEEVVRPGENFSFDVSAMAGKKCSLVLEINLEYQDYMGYGAYYLSGEQDGNNFFLSFTAGKSQHHLSPSKGKMNNVKRIFPLEGKMRKYFNMAIEKPGFDLDPAFSLTGEK